MIVIASLNSHKVDEIRQLPAAAGLELRGISELGTPPEVDENGLTFEENAVLKAVRYSLWLRRELGLAHPVVAEDSGLQVEALLGWPGIHSARVGPDAEQRNALVLEKLAGSSNRAARFVAATALARNGSLIRTWQGVVRGRITQSPRGPGGFGYDPIFELPELELTFAELSAAEKNEHSHRSKAWTDALRYLEQHQLDVA